jgi:uncharacterized membrane protein
MSDHNPKHERDAQEIGEDAPFFSAILTPYRSLGPNGFLLLMLFVGAVSFVSGLAFLLMGAWPVFGFFGLDALLIWLAFRLNYASAQAYEEVIVSRTEIIIRKVGPGKRRQEYRFNPFWVRLSVTKLEDEGVTKLSLTSRGKNVDLGNFLNPDDRTSFAGAMANALATAKTGGI